MLFLDGAYQFHGNRVTFHRARRPENSELSGLLDTLSRRIVRVLERRGLLIADPVNPYLDFAPGSSLDQLQAASITRDGFAPLLLALRASHVAARACTRNGFAPLLLTLRVRRAVAFACATV
jgi:hypothetical protein